MINILSKKNILVYGILLIATALIVFFNMVISPQYPMVYSQYNQSILYLIGKMIKSGKVPYRDVIDHKGIYILLIHYFAEVIGSNNHIGLYIIGTIFIYISVLYLYKICLLINVKNNVKELPSTIISAISALVFAVVQSLYIVSYGTLQSETIIASGIIISIYYFLSDIYNNDFSLKHTMLYGIIFAFIIFIKANYAIYFLWIAIYIFYKIKFSKSPSAVGVMQSTIGVKQSTVGASNANPCRCEPREQHVGTNIFVLQHIKFGIIGIIIGIAPGILYAIFNNFLSEMFYYTFIVNAIYSKTPYFGFDSKFDSIIYTLSQFKYIYLALILGLFLYIIVNWKEFQNKKTRMQLINAFAIMFMLIISTLASGRDYSYYLIVLLPFLSIIVNEICKSIYLLLDLIKIKVIKNVLVILILLLITFTTCNIALQQGRDLMIKNGKDQLKVAKFIKDNYNNVYAGNKKKLFILGSELYAYDYIGVLPDFKYFAIPMIEIKYYKTPYVEALDYLMSKKANVVIAGVGASMSEFYKYTDLKAIFDNDYDIIGFNYGRTALTPKP